MGLLHIATIATAGTLLSLGAGVGGPLQTGSPHRRAAFPFDAVATLMGFEHDRSAGAPDLEVRIISDLRSRRILEVWMRRSRRARWGGTRHERSSRDNEVARRAADRKRPMTRELFGGRDLRSSVVKLSTASAPSAGIFIDLKNYSLSLFLLWVFRPQEGARLDRGTPPRVAPPGHPPPTARAVVRCPRPWDRGTPG